MTDWEFTCFIEGYLEELSPRRQRQLSVIFCDEPWHSLLVAAVARRRLADSELREAPDFAYAPEELQRLQKSESRRSPWRLGLAAAAISTVAVVGIVVVNSMRIISLDLEAIASAGRALAVFSVEGRSERVRHVGMSPDKTSVDRTRPTLRWSALDAKVRVIEVVLSKDDLRISSTTDVRAGSWTVSQSLLNQSRYTWTLRYEVDQELLEADATFYVPSQEAISFANGLSAGLSDTKRASLLIELDRLPEAIRILDKVHDDQVGDVKVLEAARQLRQDAEAALRQRRG